MLDPRFRIPSHYDPTGPAGPNGPRGFVYGSPIGNAPVTLFFMEADSDHPGQSGVVGHSGLDLAAAQGTPIIALMDGTIFYKADNDPTLGNYVILEHGDIHMLYAHMENPAPPAGYVVRYGLPIGTVGMTGFTTGPHLHWMVADKNQNPFCRANTQGLYDPIGRFVLPTLTAADVSAAVLATPFFTSTEPQGIEGVRNVDIFVPNPPQPKYPGTAISVPLHN